MKYIIPLLLLLSACTDNSLTKNFGGSQTIQKPNQNFILENITWKDNQLWILWFDPQSKNCYFIEKSNFNFLQGNITIPNCK